MPARIVVNEPLDVFDRERLGEKIALAVFAPKDTELMKLMNGLDALGDNL